MTQRLQYYIDIKDRLMAADSIRDKTFRSYLDMYHAAWSLPSGLENYDWLRKEISTEPHDAIAAGVRVMTSIPPKPKVIPVGPTTQDKVWANEKERAMSSWLHQANTRRPVSVEADVMLSALLYMAEAINVVDLEWQIKIAQEAEASTKRLAAARQMGRFVVNTFNPGDVHVLRSSYGPEMVVLCQQRLASEVLYEWGKRARKLKDLADKGEYVTYYSAMDYDDQVVWVEGASDKNEIIREKHDLPFLPWVALMGGSTLEAQEEYKYHPILFPIHFSGQWDTKNVVRSVYYSDVIARGAAPRGKIVANDVNNPPQVNYMDPARMIVLGPGEDFVPTPPPQIDSAATEVEDRLAADIGRSTVSPVLMGGEVAAGTSFAALNLQTLTATGALKPAKDLAEKALAEVFKLMCHWIYHTGIGDEVPDVVRKEKAMEFTGGYVSVDAEDDALPELNITVELKPDLPTDQLQRINAATIGINAGILSKEQAMEDIGIQDPETMMKQIFREKVIDHKLQMKFMQEEAQIQADIQAQQMQMEQQQAPQPSPEMPYPQQPEVPQPMMDMMQGEGFNPAMGGMPPALMNPDMTREATQGVDFAGNPMAV